jgi:hypothetical protein
MNRKVWTGVLAGLLAATVVLGVGIGGFRAGQRHEIVTRVAGDGDGGPGVVRVIDDGRHWGYGPGPGFFLFPLLGIGLVFLLVGRGRHRGYGYGGGGWCGPGPGAGGGPESRMADWHRQAHEQERASTPPASTPPAASPPASSPPASTPPTG